jgi:hypothetical protein
MSTKNEVPEHLFLTLLMTRGGSPTTSRTTKSYSWKSSGSLNAAMHFWTRAASQWAVTTSLCRSAQPEVDIGDIRVTLSHRGRCNLRLLLEISAPTCFCSVHRIETEKFLAKNGIVPSLKSAQSCDKASTSTQSSSG